MRGVELSNSPPPACLDVVYDPCLITAVSWDGTRRDDFPCSAPRFELDELARITAALDALAPDIAGGTCSTFAPTGGSAGTAGPTAAIALSTFASRRVGRWSDHRRCGVRMSARFTLR